MVTVMHVDLSPWCQPVSKIKGSSVNVVSIYAKMLFNEVTCIVIIYTTVLFAH